MFYKKIFISCPFSFQAHLVKITFFHFCFVFRHVVKQEKGSALPANRVLWVIVFHVPCFSPHPLILLIDSLRPKRSHFSLSRPKTKSHR